MLKTCVLMCDWGSDSSFLTGRHHLTSVGELPWSIGNVLEVFEEGITSRYCSIILYYIQDGNYSQRYCIGTVVLYYIILTTGGCSNCQWWSQIRNFHDTQAECQQIWRTTLGSVDSQNIPSWRAETLHVLCETYGDIPKDIVCLIFTPITQGSDCRMAYLHLIQVVLWQQWMAEGWRMQPAAKNKPLIVPLPNTHETVDDVWLLQCSYVVQMVKDVV